MDASFSLSTINLLEISYIIILFLFIFSLSASLLLIIKFKSKLAIMAAIPFWILCADYILLLLHHYILDSLLGYFFDTDSHMFINIFIFCISYLITLLALIIFFKMFWKLLKLKNISLK
jgi:hypothetical protein